MSQSKPLLDAALQGAGLANPTAEDEFWAQSIEDPTAIQEKYIDYRLRLPVNEKVIFYETMSGARMGDNPFAIFEYLRAHPEYRDYLHVWSLSADSTIPDKYTDQPDVVFTPCNSAAYVYFLACAGRIVCNANLPGYFARRPEQRYLNTWHGVPYKALGRNTPKARFGGPASTGTFLKATHVLSTCRFMTEAFLSAYSMSGTSTAQIAETGYPRVDLTVTPEPQDTARIRKILGIAEDEDETAKPVVLYAPTWRAEGGSDVVDTDQLMGDLNALAALDIHVLYRGHHRMDRLIRDHFVGEQLGNVIIPPHAISSNELLTVVDVLITDYSSIFFDFLPTGRPVIHYLYDLDEYKRTRGLNLTLQDLPGVVARTPEELVRTVDETSAVIATVTDKRGLAEQPLQGAKYKRAQRRFCAHEDGHASQRAVDFFFKDVSGDFPILSSRDARPTKAFWAGHFEDTHPSSSFLRKVIDSGGSPLDQTTLVIARNAKVSKETLGKIKALKGHISTVAYELDQPVLLSSEQEAYERFLNMESLTLQDVRRLLREDPVLKGVFVREYRRRLDDAQFDSVVLAPGLANHELALASLADRHQSLSNAPRIARGQQLPMPIRRAVNVLLPPGTARRKQVGRVYRSIRRRVSKLRS